MSQSCKSGAGREGNLVVAHFLHEGVVLAEVVALRRPLHVHVTSAEQDIYATRQKRTSAEQLHWSRSAGDI